MAPWSAHFPFRKYDESCIDLNTGDLLVCYTDGITEPENAYGEMFGEERLIELVKKHAHHDDEEIIRSSSKRFEAGPAPELHDDMTLLLARQVCNRMKILTAAEMREVDRLRSSAAFPA